MSKKDHQEIMAQIFGDAGITDVNTSVDFLARAIQIDNSTRERYPIFANYFESNLKSRLQNFVFSPNRSRHSTTQWTNNNAESINNILKLSTSWNYISWITEAPYTAPGTTDLTQRRNTI